MHIKHPLVFWFSIALICAGVICRITGAFMWLAGLGSGIALPVALGVLFIVILILVKDIPDVPEDHCLPVLGVCGVAFLIAAFAALRGESPIVAEISTIAFVICGVMLLCLYGVDFQKKIAPVR